MNASATASLAKLTWHRSADGYSERSACGRFIVARMTAQEGDHYIATALELGRDELDGTVVKSRRELGSRKVSPRATNAERWAAINAMRELCEREAR